MYKYMKRIVLILIIILMIFIKPNITIAGQYDGTVEESKKSLSELKEKAVGKTIGFTIGTTEETLGQFDLNDHMYCLQHKDDSKSGRFVIDAYVEIKGNIATGTYIRGGNSVTKRKNSNWVWNNEVNSKIDVLNQNTKRIQKLINDRNRKERLILEKKDSNGEQVGPVTLTKKARSNMVWAYLISEENYYKGYGHDMVRDRSILYWYANNWFSNVGSKIGLYNKWDYSYGLGHLSDSDQKKITDFKTNAEKYAKEKEVNEGDLHCVPEISSTREKMNLKDNIAGPFKVNYNGRIDTVRVIYDEKNNYAINPSVLKIYYMNNKKKVYLKNLTDIKSGVNYYIESSSIKKMKKLEIKLKDNTVLKCDIWFIERADEADAQRLITVQDSKEKVKGAKISIEIKEKEVPTGNIKIYKKDSASGANISGAGFKIKTEEGWLSGTSKETYKYNATEANATIYEMTRNKYNSSDSVVYPKKDKNGNVCLEIQDLKYGEYELYEVKAPTGYDITKQVGYNANKKYVKISQKITIADDSDEEIIIYNDNYISISGYVWVDTVSGNTKLTDTDNLWNQNEIKVSNVTVRLKRKGNNSGTISTTKTGTNGEYRFNNVIKTSELQNYYIEFDYSGTQYKNYIPVAFNAEKSTLIKENGSRAIVQNMPEYDKDFQSVATTYTGQNDASKERTYGLMYNGHLFEALYNEDTNTLENINLGIKEIPEPQYDITQNLATFKITMKGFTYTYVYGGDNKANRIYAPQVKWQKKNDISAYTRSFYPSDISYDQINKTEELKAEVKYRIDIKNTETMNMDTKYKEETMYLKQLVDEFDAKRYTLNDSNWTAGRITTDSNGKKKQIATLNNLKSIQLYDDKLGIPSNNTVTAYINFSVNHSAILDILNNYEEGIIEEYPTKATSIAYHKYSRNDYSWNNNILKKQTHYTVDKSKNAEAPYLIFKLGSERTIRGKVFEDKVVTDNGEKLGNGTNEKNENAVKDVKVELLDTSDIDKTDFTKLRVSNLYTTSGDKSKPVTTISQIAITQTNNKGEFTLEGIVPGYYIIRYTYGDGTHKYTDSKGNELSVNILSKIRNSEGKEKNALVKDYKSTIVKSQKAKNALENETENTLTWYRNLEGENYSVAIDSLSRRKDLNNNNIILPDMNDETIDETKAISSETEKNVMYAKTGKMLFSVENENAATGNVNIVKDKNGKNIQEEKKYEIKGINFGIIEQPKQKAKIEKVITYITLTNSQNNVVFDGNPENAKMQGVSDLDNKQNGGSTYVRAEVLEDIIYSSKLELNYEIRVTNVSDVNYYDDKYYLYGDKNGAHEITLKVNEVTDYLDETLKYLPEKSDKDRISTEIKTMKLDDRNTQVLKLNKWDDVLFTNKVNNNSRKTTDKVTIVAERALSREDKDMEFINEAEITGIQHATETGNTNEEKLKIAPAEVHTNGRVKVVTTITPPTGENKQMIIYYAIAGIVALAILSVGIVIIKKKIK